MKHADIHILEGGVAKHLQFTSMLDDLTADKRLKKIGKGNKLEKYDLESLPDVIKLNHNKYKEWLD